MSYQPQLSALSLLLEQLAKRFGFIRGKLPRLPSRWIIVLSVCVLAVLAFLLRCMHLFDANHYYIISPDSYFFHWVAKGIMAGEPPSSSPGAAGPYTLHSGLAYPLAYIAKAASSVFGLSSPDALALVAKFLPPVIGVISIVLIYLFAARICGRRIGLLSALAWAFLLWPVTFGAAGYLDRDGLSMLLFTIGAFLFYLSGVWHIKLRGSDVGWLIAGAGVLVIEGLLYLEWTWVGPVMLLAVVAAYFVGRFLLEYLERMETEPDVRRRLAASIGVVNWRAFALIMVANAVVAGVNFHQSASWFDFATSLVRSKGSVGIVEEQGLSFADLTGFQFFIIPMVVALYLAWKRRAESSIFFSIWFIILLILAVFSKRVLLYALPAACLLSGVGLAFLLDWVGRGLYYPWKMIGMAVLLGLTIVLSFESAYTLAAVPAIAPDRQWQSALAYLRDETPQNSVIMSQWSWGYWILDLGQRRPLVDNGYYGYDAERLRDVGLAYSTTDPAEAAQIMKKDGVNYLVLSELDTKYAVTIMGWDNVGEGLSNFPGNSLIMRSLNGEFESGGGLEVVYRSPPEPNSSSPNEPEVVILGLTQP